MSSATAAFLGLLEYKLLVGLLVSAVGGSIVVWALVSYLRHHTGEKWEEPRVRVPAWLTGVIERGVFTLLIAYQVDDIGTLMAGWLALKLASNWNRPERTGEEAAAYAFSALLAGLVSLAFAALGGRIALGDKPLWW